jgi:hypothetical protein
MTIPTTPQTETIHRLARELRDAQAQLTLAAARVSDIATRLAAAKAAQPTAPPLTDEQAAVEAVVVGLAGGWVEQ